MDAGAVLLRSCVVHEPMRSWRSPLTEAFALWHWPAFRRQRQLALFTQSVPAVATDLHTDKTRAIRAGERVGFQVGGPPRDSDPGRLLPMEMRARELLRYKEIEGPTSAQGCGLTP